MIDTMFIYYIIMTVMAFALGYLYAMGKDKPTGDEETPRQTIIERVFIKKENDQKPNSKPPDEEDINSFYQ